MTSDPCNRLSRILSLHLVLFSPSSDGNAPYVHISAVQAMHALDYSIENNFMPLIASSTAGWAFFRPENVKEQRERRKTMAEKGKDRNEEETLKHQNPFSMVSHDLFGAQEPRSTSTSGKTTPFTPFPQYAENRREQKKLGSRK